MVSFDPKLKKVKGGSREKLILHNNRDTHQLSEPQKDELVTWNYTTDVMNSK